MIITGRHLMAIPLLLVLAAGSGCKKGFANLPAKLHGKITYKNAPVTGGVIILYGADGGAYNVVIQNDGTFSQADLPAGLMNVAVTTEAINPDKKTPEYKGATGMPGGGGSSKAATSSPIPDGANVKGTGTYVKIPARYMDRNQSKLTVTLKAGDNEATFELTD